MENFGLDTKINGKNINEYIADLLEKNDRLELEIDRGKMAVALLKQTNNNSRIQLDAKKYELKKMEFDIKQGNILKQTNPA